MKPHLHTLIGVSAISVMALTATAQNSTTTNRALGNQGAQRDQGNQRDQSARSHNGEERTQSGHRLNGAAKSTELIGMTVNNYQNEKLGKVEDLAVDVESGRVVQVILSTGGFLGMGTTMIAVPPGALHHDVAQNVVHLDANKEKLKSAPKFTMEKWADCCDNEHLTTVYRHYGQEPAFKFVRRGDAVLDEHQKNVQSSGTRVQSSDNKVQTTDGVVTTRQADGTWSKDKVQTSHVDRDMIPESRLNRIQKASALIGVPVVNQQEEKLGDVENVLIDLAAGRIVAVIISTGGFLGIGDELSAVPPSALRFNEVRDTLQLDASKEMLSQAPHFNSSLWPDFNQPRYSSSVYQAYQVDPYFTTNLTTEADNTARNVRDRDERMKTPTDQGNSKSDVTMTADIRKGILSGKDMSVNAQNVKIITLNGQVTLRGPVNTSEEKRRIGEIANNIAQSANVNNLLEVK